MKKGSIIKFDDLYYLVRAVDENFVYFGAYKLHFSDVELFMDPGKQTEKIFTKYLILEFLYGCKAFNGVSMIDYVNSHLGRELYANTVVRYMWELQRSGNLKYECLNKQKSQYSLDWSVEPDLWMTRF